MEAKAVKLGLNHPMGPLELADLIGLDTIYNSASARKLFSILVALVENFGHLLIWAFAPVSRAYCFKCQQEREMKDPKQVALKNDRPAVQGTCPVCGTKLFRIGKL